MSEQDSREKVALSQISAVVELWNEMKYGFDKRNMMFHSDGPGQGWA